MKYEYNGNLLENDRINLVANEIINKYPHININEAREIAMLEGKISTDKDIEMEFNRLYNIMLIINSNKESIKPVYMDMVNLLDNNKNNEKIDYYCAVLLEIYNFLMSQREFPLLDEFQ